MWYVVRVLGVFNVRGGVSYNGEGINEPPALNGDHNGDPNIKAFERGSTLNPKQLPEKQRLAAQSLPGS